MPEVPEWNLPKIKPIYNPTDVSAPATLKQRSLIDTLCRRRKIELPDMKSLTKGQAAAVISRVLESVDD